MKKQILSILLSVLMVLTLVPNTLIFSSAAYIESGKCGNNLTYTLDDTGTLTISGTGNMTDYTQIASAPWKNNKESIKTVIIGSGVTSIGNFAFYDCINLKNIDIPADVEHIGELISFGCSSLTSINVNSDNKNYSSLDGVLFNKDKTTLIAYPSAKSDTEYSIPFGVTTISDRAFNNCRSLININIPYTVKNYEEGAFSACLSLKSIIIPDGVKVIEALLFFSCLSLKTVIIPDSVTNINFAAFLDCGELNDVYYKGTAAQWEDIVIDSGNETVLSAAIHYNYNPPAHQHIPGGWIVDKEPTCKEEGLKHQVCSLCGETIRSEAIKKSDSHSLGEWVTTKKPTYSETGSKERKCTVCGKTESAVIPVLKANTVINAQNADVSLKYDNKVLKEKVKLHVNEEYSGGAFEIINNRKGFFSNKVFDITLTGANGKVQPDGFVLVGISLPENFNEENTFVYYVSEKDNSITKMNSYVKNGIIWFETDHFSAYAVVDETKRLDGDMDDDGKLTAGDARTVLRASVGLEELSDVEQAAADVNKDKAITAADARIVLRRSVGLPD